MIKARVTVTLKNGVLDPQGQAIQGSLKSLGFEGVSGVRQGKVFDLELSAADPASARFARARCSTFRSTPRIAPRLRPT